MLYSHQRKYIQCSSQDLAEPGYVNIRELAEAMCRYDLDDMDLYWLYSLNRELKRMGMGCKEGKYVSCIQNKETWFGLTVAVDVYLQEWS